MGAAARKIVVMSSWVVTSRPMGILRSMLATTSGFSKSSLVNGVKNPPGDIEFTVMPSWAHSTAKARVSCNNAPLLVV